VVCYGVVLSEMFHPLSSVLQSTLLPVETPLGCSFRFTLFKHRYGLRFISELKLCKKVGFCNSGGLNASNILLGNSKNE